jgi:Ku protein
MAGKNTLLEIGAAVVIPVKLEKVSVRQDVRIDRATKDGNRIKRVEVDAVTDEPVLDGTVKQGIFENPKEGTGFHEIPEDALEAISEQTKLDSFQVKYFVPLKDLPTERFQSAYYLTPQTGVNPRPLKLLYEALKRTKKAGVFKLTLTSRQYLAAVYAHNGGVIVNLMHFADDFQKVERASEKLAGVEANKAHLALAVELIENMSAEASVIDTFEDSLIPLKQDLVDKALAGKAIKPKKGAEKVPRDERDLAAQLRASMDEIRKQKEQVPA